MKTIISLILIGVAASIYSQTNFPLHEWRITVHVVDETGVPVAGADAGIGYFTNTVATSMDGLTDTDGNFSASYQNAFGGTFGLVAKKSGYYAVHQKCIIPVKYDAEKWNPQVTLVLKQIGEPTAMYVKHAFNTIVPETNKSIGYDLEVGDWVGPYGKGIQTDMFFKKELKEDGGYFKLTVSFPNRDDGIQVYVPKNEEKGSMLHSPHIAPLTGYQSELTRETGRLPGQKPKFEYDEHRIYLLRVRSRVDDRGNLVSAHYGKIYGDFMQFSHYLNPTPNDRNIEFNSSQNLIKNLNEFQQVNAP